MSGDVHVRFREGVGVRVPRATRLLLGLTGPKAEAEEIKELLRTFLRDRLRLELSEEKTLITHATTEAARFLGYEVTQYHCDTRHDSHGRRSINGDICLRVPADVVEKRCALYRQRGKPIHRAELANDSDFTIVERYQSEYRGYVQYYGLAQNIHLLDKLRWTTTVSLLKTLAFRHKASVNEMVRRYASTVATPMGPRRCFVVKVERDGHKPLIARFGGIPLKRQPGIELLDQPTTIHYKPRRTELLKRLLAGTCELCGHEGRCEVHHIRKLADLNVKGRREKPLWAKTMAARRRKTMVLCRSCHMAIQHGKPRQHTTSEQGKLESRVM